MSLISLDYSRYLRACVLILATLAQVNSNPTAYPTISSPERVTLPSWGWIVIIIVPTICGLIGPLLLYAFFRPADAIESTRKCLACVCTSRRTRHNNHTGGTFFKQILMCLFCCSKSTYQSSDSSTLEEDVLNPVSEKKPSFIFSSWSRKDSAMTMTV